MDFNNILTKTLNSAKTNIINTATDYTRSSVTSFTKEICKCINTEIKTNFYPSISFDLSYDRAENFSKAIIKMCPNAESYLDETGRLKYSKTIISQIKNLPAIAIIKTPRQEFKYDHDFAITIVGYKPYSLLQKFIRTYKSFNSIDKDDEIGINTLSYVKDNQKKYWDVKFQSVNTKSINELFTDADLSNLITRINKWNDSKEIYKQLNIIYKTGILLYGLPGTGKTSLAKAIAKELDAPIYVVNMGDFNEEQISAIKNDIEVSYEDKTVILIFEDIDCIFSTRDELKTEKQKQSAQLLLQFLDGTFSIPNIISIATTNHIEVLDPALIRDGRFDIKIEMKNISRESAVRLCRHFNVDSNDIPELLENEQFPINPSYIQNKILKYLLEKLQSEYTTT